MLHHRPPQLLLSSVEGGFLGARYPCSARAVSYERGTLAAPDPAASRVSPALHRAYLTQCVYLLVLESQLPHKIVNLLSTITDQYIKLTVLWRVEFLKLIDGYVL